MCICLYFYVWLQIPANVLRLHWLYVKIEMKKDTAPSTGLVFKDLSNENSKNNADAGHRMLVTSQ